MNAPEPLYPNEVICGECYDRHLEQTDRERDGIAWWLSYKCPECGATGKVEERFNGTTVYHGDLTTPRRVKRERQSEGKMGLPFNYPKGGMSRTPR